MNKRVKYTVALAGLAVIGGGAYAITDRMAGRDTEAMTPDAARRPSIAVSAPPSSEAMTGPQVGPTMASAAAAATLNLGREAFQRLNAAKEAGKNDIETQRAIPQPVVTAPLQRWEEGSLREKGRILRVVSAKQDLTNYHELAWVAGMGKKVGSSRCSQTLKMSNEQEPRTRPTMVICWRLSPKKSVYSLMIDLKGKPSMEESVARIDKTWAKMN